MSFQLYQASTAFLFGIAAGFYYDFLKAIRRRSASRGLTLLADILFWIALATALFVQTMTLGRGQLRLFMLIANALGLGMYFFALSPPVLFVLNKVLDYVLKILHLIGAPLRKIWAKCKKVSEKVKKDFQKLDKRCTIRYDGLSCERKQAFRKKTGGDFAEGQEGKYFYEIGGAGDSGVRRSHTGGSARANRRRKRKSGGHGRGRGGYD